MNSWNSADKLFWTLLQAFRHPLHEDKVHRNFVPELIPFLDWLSKSEVQLDTILCLVSGHMDTYCVCS